jgi:DegV family protein with EDD domain
MTIKIITDSSADLPEALANKLGISIVPLSVHFGAERMPNGFSAREFYRKMRESKDLPTTASPCPHDFLTMYKEAGEQDDILVLCLSSNMSSTYQSALIAKEMYEEEGHTNSIEVVDSLSVSLGLGLLAVKAAKQALTDTAISELTQKVKQYVKEITTYFTLDTLENVIKGGRLDRLRGTVASVLNIKLLMRIGDEGTVEVTEKVRGMQNALNRIIEKIGEKHHDFENAILAIAHSNSEERALALKERILARFPFKEVILAEMGPLIGTYAGEGGIGVAYLM